MMRHLLAVCLPAVAIAAISADTSDAEEVALNFAKIPFELVDEAGSRIRLGGASTFSSLPMDFFGPGSEPFSGDVVLKGKKIHENLVLERTAGAIFDPPSAPQDIPLEMVELSLASAEPIVVTYSDGLTEQWDMTINLDRDETSSCWIRASHNPSGEPDGGTIFPTGSFFDVYAEITFTHTPPSGAPRHRFFAIIDRTNLTTSDATWAHRHDSIGGGANRDFIPGADPAAPSAPPQVLFFDGGGLDLAVRVLDVVPEPSSLILIAVIGMLLPAFVRRRRR